MGQGVRGLGGALGAALSWLSARLAAARGPQVGARSARTSNTRTSPGSAGAKPASMGRTKHSCATVVDFIEHAFEGVAGSKTSGGDAGSNTSGGIATRTRAANRSIASTSKGTVVVSDPNPFGPLRDLAEEATTLAPALAPALTHAPRRSKRINFPHLTDADATAASVASGNKRARTFEALTHSRSPSPSQQHVKTRKVTNKDAVEPLSRPKTRAVTMHAQRTDAAATDEVVRNPTVVAVVAALSPKDTTGPRRSGRNHVTAVAAPRSTRGAAAVAAPRGNAATTVAPPNTRERLAESGRIAREMADALLRRRDRTLPSPPVPDATEVEARKAADDARNAAAAEALAASTKRYAEGPPVTYDDAVKDILAEYKDVVTEWQAEPDQSTPKPENLKKTELNSREQVGIARMHPRWRDIARAHLEYGVPPPHSFPFQQWAHLDDALTALAEDCPAMATLRQAGSFLGVFLTDGHLAADRGKFSLHVASPNFCIATRDALSSCIDWRVFQGEDFGPLPHDIERMKFTSESSAVFQGLRGPHLKKCTNDADCPHFLLESTTTFERSVRMFYPTRSRSGDSGCGKKRVPMSWLGSSHRAVQLGLAATPGFEDGEMAGDGSVSTSDCISIAHIDVTQSEIEFLLDLKAQQLRRDGSSGKLRYGGFPFAVSGSAGIECTEAALTAAGHRAVGSSVRRSATIRFQEIIGSLPPRDSICARAYAHKLRHFEDLNHTSMSRQMRAERAWDVFSIAKMRVVDELTTEQICIRLREERQQPCLKLEEVKSMLLTAVGEVTRHSNPGVGLWPSPVQKTTGVGSRISHRIVTIRALNENILKPVRDASVAARAHFKNIFGAALERDCFLMDWDNLVAIVPICMVDKADDGTRYSPEEQAAQIAYTSRSQPYSPCEPPPADELLEELRRRSPQVILTPTMKFLGDHTVWTRQKQAGRFVFLHIATGFTEPRLCMAENFQAKLEEFRAAGIVCGKDSTTGRPLFSHADGWSTRGKSSPVQSANRKRRSILKELERASQVPTIA